MALHNVPFWMSEAKTEFRATDGSAVTMLAHAYLPAPRWVSALGGQANVIKIRLPGGMQGTIDIPSKYITDTTEIYEFTVPESAYYIADSVGVGAIQCITPANCTIIVENGARVYGRGGNGAESGFTAARGGDGGPAIKKSSHISYVNNGGQVLGGGGGGGQGQSAYKGGTNFGNHNYPIVDGGAGGGGVPYGQHGGGKTPGGTNATSESEGQGGAGQAGTWSYTWYKDGSSSGDSDPNNKVTETGTYTGGKGGDGGRLGQGGQGGQPAQGINGRNRSDGVNINQKAPAGAGGSAGPAVQNV